MGLRKILDTLSWVAIVNAWDPKNDGQFPAVFQQQTWATTLKVDPNVTRDLPDQMKARVGKFEKKEDKVYKRLLRTSEFKLPGLKPCKQPGADATFLRKVLWHCLVLLGVGLFWLVMPAIVTLPNLSLGLIGEKIFNIRNVPTASFTVWQLIPFFLNALQYGSACLQFVRERGIGPVTLSIWFTPLAFNAALRYLYDAGEYLAPSAIFGILLQLSVQFGERLWYRYWLNRRIAKKGLPAPAANLIELGETSIVDRVSQECDRLQNELKQFTTWAKSQKFSKTTNFILTTFKRGHQRKIDYLRSSLPNQPKTTWRAAFAKFRKSPKQPYAYANGIILFGNAFFYIGAWGTFFQALGYATVMEVNTILNIMEENFTMDDMKSFTTNTVSSLFGQLFFVGIPYRATKTRAVDDHRYYIMMFLQETYVLIFSDIAVPKLIEFAQWIWRKLSACCTGSASNDATEQST